MMQVANQNGASFTGHARAPKRDRTTWVLFAASVVVIPIFVAFATPLMTRAIAAAFVTDMLLWDSVAWSFGHVRSAIERGGSGAAIVLAFTYIFANGILIVACLVLSRWLNQRRILVILAFGLAVPLAMTVPRDISQWKSTLEHLDSASDDAALASHWIEHRGQASPYVFLGIVLGAIVCILPVFRPGKHHWLARGMCPKCQYDLKGNIDAGCPECGWKRDVKSKNAS